MFYRRIILVDKTFCRETTVKKIIYNVTMANRDISSIELFAIVIVTLDFTSFYFMAKTIFILVLSPIKNTLKNRIILILSQNGVCVYI